MQELLASEQTSTSFAIYISVLFSSCLACTIAFLFKKTRRTYYSRELPTWNISWVDFGIFIWLLFVWILLASRLSNLLELEKIEQTEQWNTIVNSFGMQGGMIIIFLVFRIFKSGNEGHRLSMSKKSFAESMFQGIFCMLLIYPWLALLNVFWTTFLQILNSLGLNIPIEKQLVVQYFQNAPSTEIFVGFSIVAVIIAPIAEEFIFRAGIYRFFKSKMGLHRAALLSASLFAMLHFSIIGFPALLLLGYFLAIVYERSTNIWVGICLHAFFNFNSVLLIVLHPNL